MDDKKHDTKESKKEKVVAPPTIDEVLDALTKRVEALEELCKGFRR